MQIPPFVSLCKYGFWSHERTHSIVIKVLKRKLCFSTFLSNKTPFRKRLLFLNGSVKKRTKPHLLPCSWAEMEKSRPRREPIRLGNLSFDDGNINDNATNQWFDWLNEEKQSCCTCGTLFGAMFWRSLPNDDVKFSYLWFWRQRELAAVNLSLFAFTWKPFVPS